MWSYEIECLNVALALKSLPTPGLGTNMELGVALDLRLFSCRRIIDFQTINTTIHFRILCYF